MVVAGRDLQRSSGPNSLLKQGYPEPGAQRHGQEASEYIQGQRLYSLSGQPVPLLGHPQSKNVFSHIQRKAPVFQGVPIASGMLMGTHLHPLCTLPSGILYISKILPSLQFSRLE